MNKFALCFWEVVLILPVANLEIKLMNNIQEETFAYVRVSARDWKIDRKFHYLINFLSHYFYQSLTFYLSVVNPYCGVAFNDVYDA